MAKYKKRSDKNLVVIPGVGPITSDDKILEGDQFDRFCPGLLERVPDNATLSGKDPLPAPPKVPVEVEDNAPQDDEEEEQEQNDSEETGSEEETEPGNTSGVADYSEWAYADLRDEVKKRELVTDGRTKADFVEALTNDDKEE